MTDQSLVERLMSADPIEALDIAWNSQDLTLAERARIISHFHMHSRMTLEGTARLTGATPAEVLALLELATLEDDDLDLISKANPPATTWFLFAGANPETIQAGVAALEEPREKYESKLEMVYHAMRTASGPSLEERIITISGPTLGHLAHKAKQYKVLTPKARKFLVDLANRKRTGARITEKQLAWLKSLLFELVEKRVVRRDSVDNDQVECDEVLDALGV